MLVGYRFGRFELLPEERQLLAGGVAVRVTPHAFDLLVVLLECAGRLVTKEHLLNRVWARVVVEENTLQAHISALRKVLGVDAIATVSGRGYRFVPEVVRLDCAPTSDVRRRKHNLPNSLDCFIGREEEIAHVKALLASTRFLTVTGAGGCGKTRLAVRVALEMVDEFSEGCWLVELAPLVDSSRVLGAVASALGVPVPSDDPLPALSAWLVNRKLLIVLDNCEHVIEAAAVAAWNLLKRCAGISILATSREPLNAEGEWLFMTPSLAVPSDVPHVTAAQILPFAAVQLFVQRAAAVSHCFELCDTNAPVIRDLCRRLDGIPLAIELAAARAHTLGVSGLAAGLDDRFRMLTGGHRDALPRHRTLKATLDWSFGLLSKPEQAVLCRLAVFRASFTLESACCVGVAAEISPADVVECTMGLSAKSLISVNATGDVTRYRLLETTRAYALERLMRDRQSATAFRQHALHMKDLLTRAEADWDQSRRADWVASYCRDMEDVHAAIGWCFSSDSDSTLAIELVAAALLPVYELGLLDEHHEWIQRALNQIHLLSPPQPLLEMRLNAALVFPSGRPKPAEPTQSALVDRMLELAEQLGEPKYRIAALYSLWGKDFRAGDYVAAINSAEGIGILARDSGDAAAALLSDRLLAQTRHFTGEHPAARAKAESVLHQPATRMPPAYISPVPHAVAMRIVLARILWLEGHADQAVEAADECMAHAAGHPFAFTQALALAACPIALWRGDDRAARLLVDQLVEHSSQHPSAYWQTWGRSYDAVLSVRESRASGARSRWPAPLFPTTSAMELDCIDTMATGQVSTDTLVRVERGTVGWCAPEILRAHAESMLRQGVGGPSAPGAAIYAKSLALARSQGALAWELRTATSLGRLWRDQDRMGEVRQLVSATYERFTEGLETADLRAAKHLLEEIGA
jgi:predicted ATPase/DNA-binding winged helix-turn-helix (wHTH) protein